MFYVPDYGLSWCITKAFGETSSQVSYYVFYMSSSVHNEYKPKYFIRISRIISSFFGGFMAGKELIKKPNIVVS